MKICVIGAGAMGGLYGCRLLLSGKDVQFIETRQQAVDALNAGTYLFDGIDGEHRIKALAATSANGLDAADIAFIHTDTNNTAAAGEHAKAVLKPSGWAVTFQNGVGNVETLCDALSTNVISEVVVLESYPRIRFTVLPLDVPLTTFPSTANLSPGRTTTTSSTLTSDNGVSISSLPLITLATCG